MTQNVATRSAVHCVIFGPPSDIPVNQLPTYSDVIRQCNMIRYQLKKANNNKEPSLSDILEATAQKVESVWNKASLPTVSHNRVTQMMRKHHDEYRKSLKSKQGEKNKSSFALHVGQLKNCSDKLFDICTCKCSDDTECKCDKSRKVPPNERNFISDQRLLRQMVIGNIDIKQSIQIRKRQERKVRMRQRMMLARPSRKIEGEVGSCLVQEEQEENEKEDEHEEQEVVVDEDAGTKIAGDSTDSKSIDSKQNNTDVKTEPVARTSKAQLRVKLPRFALACDRYGVSDRSAAAIASAVFARLLNNSVYCYCITHAEYLK